jgi:hypothetical protein
MQRDRAVAPLKPAQRGAAVTTWGEIPCGSAPLCSCDQGITTAKLRIKKLKATPSLNPIQKWVSIYKFLNFLILLFLRIFCLGLQHKMYEEGRLKIRPFFASNQFCRFKMRYALPK